MSDRDWLARLEFVGIKLGLETIRALLDQLGHPERAAPAIHIAGTNGKGSVAAMVSRALDASGYRTGRYTSPHLVRLEERFAVAGRALAPEALDRALARVRAAAARIGAAPGASPTYFEVTTAVAFEAFREAGVDVSVLEVGLGGRFDATNVVTPAVSVITSIALDHESYLGTTLEAIAAEKAGIIKPGVPVVVGSLPPAALQVVEDAARDAEAPAVLVERRCTVEAAAVGDGRYRATARTAGREYGPVVLGLRGRHQVGNAAVAIVALEEAGHAGLRVPAAAIETGLREARWPARLDLIDLGGRMLLVDGAHNPAGAEALAAYLREAYPSGVPIVFGAMGDKDVRGMLAHLAPHSAPLIVTHAPGRRALAAEEVARIAHALPGALDVLVEPEPDRALDAAWRHAPTIVVAGSLFLAGAVLALVGRPPE
jgi:dihydrofolate synthase/folylpolyglutamate synthase